MINGRNILKKQGTPHLIIIICHNFDVNNSSNILVDIIFCRKLLILGAINISDSSRP